MVALRDTVTSTFLFCNDLYILLACTLLDCRIRPLVGIFDVCVTSAVVERISCRRQMAS
jgi:hypothetical protein